jgi:hypothetical protein
VTTDHTESTEGEARAMKIDTSDPRRLRSPVIDRATWKATTWLGSGAHKPAGYVLLGHRVRAYLAEEEL